MTRWLDTQEQIDAHLARVGTAVQAGVQRPRPVEETGRCPECCALWSNYHEPVCSLEGIVGDQSGDHGASG